MERPLRRRLPDTRAGLTHKFDIQGHEGYITVGLFEDSTPGEVFITMAKQGSTIGGLMDTIATLISLNLQYGVPVEAIVRKFEHMRFEPAGFTMNPDIPMAKSMMDYLARWLGMEFVPGYREANAPKRDMNAIEPPTPSLFNEPVEHMAEADGRGYEGCRDAGRRGRPGAGRPLFFGFNVCVEYTEEGRGHGNGKQGVVTEDAVGRRMAKDTLSQATAKMMGDAPVCTCGSITVRNGSCYKCLNCGTESSLGCLVTGMTIFEPRTATRISTHRQGMIETANVEPQKREGLAEEVNGD